MTAMPDILWVLAIVGVVGLVIVILSDEPFDRWARNEWRLMRLNTWEPEDDERATRLALKRQAAVAKMKRHGIKSLLDGRPAWQRINPMGEKAAPEKVVRMRRPG